MTSTTLSMFKQGVIYIEETHHMDTYQISIDELALFLNYTGSISKEIIISLKVILTLGNVDR